MSDQRKSSQNGLLGWLLAGVFLLVCAISFAGIQQERMDLTAVALSLVAFMGVIVRQILGKKDDDDQ